MAKIGRQRSETFQEDGQRKPSVHSDLSRTFVRALVADLVRCGDDPSVPYRLFPEMSDTRWLLQLSERCGQTAVLFSMAPDVSAPLLKMEIT